LYDLKNIYIFAEKIDDNIGVFDQTIAIFYINLIITLDAEKNANFSPKIAIITSTPGLKGSPSTGSKLCTRRVRSGPAFFSGKKVRTDYDVLFPSVLIKL
jgi:hypothetical protein